MSDNFTVALDVSTAACAVSTVAPTFYRGSEVCRRLIGQWKEEADVKGRNSREEKGVGMGRRKIARWWTPEGGGWTAICSPGRETRLCLGVERRGELALFGGGRFVSYDFG